MASSAKIPLRTHLITEKDDIVEVVWRYTKDVAEPGDLITVAESVVAITQGRAFLPEQIKPGVLAQILSRYTGRGGSLTSPASMQLVINEVGWWRAALGGVAALLGKIVGRTGDFYRVAGSQAALVDDVAGTMPPYHRYIVLGPKDADKVARAIKAKTGVDAVIVDANDLHKVDVLGASGPVDVSRVQKIMADNPAGNSEEQTPIVVVKNFKRK